jgi:hypothetical protein
VSRAQAKPRIRAVFADNTLVRWVVTVGWGFYQEQYEAATLSEALRQAPIWYCSWLQRFGNSLMGIVDPGWI